MRCPSVASRPSSSRHSPSGDNTVPFVEVNWFEGRSDEQKAEIARRIEAALIDVAAVAPDHCWVKFSDSKKTDFIIGESAPD